MNYTMTTAEAARESLYNQSWMDFCAWEDGECLFWLDSNDEVIAYARFADGDTSHTYLTFFEVRDRGEGIGSKIIRDYQRINPELDVVGDIDSRAAKRFWAALGFDVEGVETIR
jgi:hypothetical protein